MSEIKIRLDKIIVNPEMQVRKELNGFWVSRLREVLRSGADFDDRIVVDGKNRVVSGFHRIAAYRSVFAPDAEISAVRREFDTDRDAYVFAVEDNTTHGKPLDAYEMKLVRHRLKGEFGATDGEISTLLGVSAERFKKWDCETVYVRGNDGVVNEVPAKSRMKGMYGTEVSAEKHSNMHEHYFGTSVAFHCKKVMERLSDDTVEPDDATLLVLGKLAEAIRVYLENMEVVK